MAILDLFGALFSSGKGDARDRYGRSRSKGGGPKVKSGPTKGLNRARNKGGEWRRKHKFRGGE